MMRALFYVSSGAFWLIILAIASVDGEPMAPVTLPPVPVLAPTPDPVRRITLAEVAQHGSANSCWMAINGQVYDLTAYLPKHPTQPSVILPSCGQDATEAYKTKNKGRAHSPRADRQLAEYPIGVLE